jgi:UDP-glucose 4-epimerase
MRIFITGVAGLLGSRLAEKLTDVAGCDNLSAGSRDNVPSHVDFFDMDCKSPLLREKLLRTDVIYHCAAHPHEGLSVFSPHTICSSIFETSVAVFSAAVAAGVKRVIFMSSMSRYGDNPLPFHENQKPAPRDPYAIAKVAAEDVLRNLCEAHGMEYVIAVPHNIVGRNQKYNDPFRNVCAIMANRMLLGKRPIVYGDGSQTRCFSDAADVVPSLLKMMDCPSGSVYNVGPDEHVVSIEEMGKLLAEIIGVTWNPIRLADRPMEVAHAVCSSNKIRDEFDYQTTKTLRETLTELVDYIKVRGPKEFDYYLPIEIVNRKTPKFWTKEIE